MAMETETVGMMFPEVDQAITGTTDAEPSGLPAVIRNATTGRWEAGTPSPNPRGRPRKGETFADKYIAATEADADALIKAHIKRAKGQSAVAARDFELAAAYHMGRPLQKYVGVVGTTGADALDAALAALVVQPQEPALPAPDSDAT